MSNPENYREPAWGGLESRPKVYSPVNSDFAQQVRSLLGLEGAVQRLANAGGPSTDFLRIDPLGGHPLFLKVVAAGRSNELALAESIAHWLQNRGVRVVAAISHGHLADGRELWAYPYHDGHPPEPSGEDMSAIGSELGKLHVALSRHPMVDDWTRETDARLAKLVLIRDALAAGSLNAGPAPAFLQRIASDGSVDFLPQRFNGTGSRLPLHGDLNRFNMLIDDSGCTFLDFEDVRHSVLPPIFDLATVFERVVMVNRPADTWGEGCAALLDAYERATGRRIDPAWLPPALKGLALRALCTLADLDPAGRDAPEWEKFFYLLALADTRFPAGLESERQIGA